MADEPDRGNGRDAMGLLGDVSHNARLLVAQQLELARAEIGQELRKAGTAAAAVAGGGGLAAAGGLLAGFALAHLLRDATGLPLWACYGVAAGGLGGAGVGLLRRGRDGLAGVRPLPETVAALGENVAWLRDQLTPAPG